MGVPLIYVDLKKPEIVVTGRSVPDGESSYQVTDLSKTKPIVFTVIGAGIDEAAKFLTESDQKALQAAEAKRLKRQAKRVDRRKRNQK